MVVVVVVVVVSGMFGCDRDVYKSVMLGDVSQTPEAVSGCILYDYILYYLILYVLLIIHTMSITRKYIHTI